MKLLLRLYDPTEGEILINGQDINTLKLEDLRSCVAALFQDFTLFPVSVRFSRYLRICSNVAFVQIRENIALGSPAHLEDNDLIERAAELGGATEIINRLPEKFDTFLQRPVSNLFSRIPEGTMSLFGSKKLHRFSNSVGYALGDDHDLSGGEKQRLALQVLLTRT